MLINIRFGEEMSVEDTIRKALEVNGTSQKDVAEKMGIKKQSFWTKLKNGTFSADEWVEIARILGYNIEMVAVSKHNVGNLKKEVGPSVQKMVSGYKFDTQKSTALCRSSVIHGFYFELFKTADERYFMVIRPEFEAISKDIPVIEVDDQKAIEFIKECGYSIE